MRLYLSIGEDDIFRTLEPIESNLAYYTTLDLTNLKLLLAPRIHKDTNRMFAR